jgi:hypothetical protein
MSRGTERYTYRLPPELVELVEATIQLRNLHTDREPWSQSDFVRLALLEKVRKMDRSRGRPIIVTRVSDTHLEQRELFQLG